MTTKKYNDVNSSELTFQLWLVANKFKGVWFKIYMYRFCALICSQTSKRLSNPRLLSTTSCKGKTIKPKF